MTLQRFASIFGIVFLVVGIVGFIPGLTIAHDHPDVAVDAGLGLALGLFPVNVLHNLVHLGFGAWGLFAARSFAQARIYAQVVAVGYAVLAVLGLISAANLHTVFGLVPLYGADVALHLLLSAIAAYFGFRRETAAPAAATR